LSAKDVFDFLSAGGTLAILVLLSLALLAGRLVGRERLDEAQAETLRERAEIEREREEKHAAQEREREAVATIKTMADALVVRNRLEEQRLQAEERRERARRSQPGR